MPQKSYGFLRDFFEDFEGIFEDFFEVEEI